VADECRPSSISEAGRLRVLMHSSMLAAWFSSPSSTSSMRIEAERATSFSFLSPAGVVSRTLLVSGKTSKPERFTNIVASVPWNSMP
jgi:hypothetical protein